MTTLLEQVRAALKPFAAIYHSHSEPADQIAYRARQQIVPDDYNHARSALAALAAAQEGLETTVEERAAYRQWLEAPSPHQGNTLAAQKALWLLNDIDKLILEREDVARAP